MNLEPQQFDFETHEKQKDRNGTTIEKRTRFSFGTQDIIAAFSGVIALIFALGMLIGKIPVNDLTIGVLTFSGVGAVIAKITSKGSKNK
jgi:hypothetical protein